MLTRRGAFRQRGMDLPKIQTNINEVEAATASLIHDVDVDAELAEFIKIDESCLDFLTPTSRRNSNTNSTATDSTTTSTGSSAGVGGGEDDDDIPWPRPTDRDIHGRSELKRTAPQWAIHVRWVLSKDFEQDSSARQAWDDDYGAAAQFQRRPSVVDRRFSYGRKIQGGRGRRPSDFSLRSPPPGLPVHYELEDIPFELVLCSEEDSFYSN